MKEYKILLCFLIFSAVIFSGCLNKTVSQGDFDLNANWGTPTSDFYFDDNTNSFRVKLILKVASSKPDTQLFYRVYDKSDGSELTSGPLLIGFNLDFYLVNLKSIDQSKEIEVCVSSNIDFIKNSEGVVCKSTSLPQRKIDIEVSPTPLTFMLSKTSLDPSYKWLTIKNIGDVGLSSVCVYPPSYANENLNYPKYKPQYGTREGFKHNGGGTSPCTRLEPGESAQYEILVSIGNFGEFDTPIGTYQSEGVVGTLFGKYLGLEYAKYKKTFNLETTVTK